MVTDGIKATARTRADYGAAVDAKAVVTPRTLEGREVWRAGGQELMMSANGQRSPQEQGTRVTKGRKGPGWSA